LKFLRAASVRKVYQAGHFLLDLWLCSWLKWAGEDHLGGIHHLQLQEVKTKGPRQYLQSLQAQEVV
jgi:hypothetical protein